MKDRINRKLLSYTEELLSKDKINITEANFLVYMLNKISVDEERKRYEKVKQESDEAWKESMLKILVR